MNPSNSRSTAALKNGTGQIFDVIAGSEVRNFDQIKVGDTLDVKYVKSLTLELKKPGTADTDSGKKSDRVMVTYAEAMAITMEPAAKKII